MPSMLQYGVIQRELLNDKAYKERLNIILEYIDSDDGFNSNGDVEADDKNDYDDDDEVKYNDRCKPQFILTNSYYMRQFCGG